MTQGQPPTFAIEATDISKAYGPHSVLKGVSLKVPVGESLVILGPNGAGKTTLIKVLATIMKPTSGGLRIGGRDPRKEPEETRRHLGVVAHDVFFYHNLTARENLEFYGRLYNLPDAAGRIPEVVEMVGMTARLHDRVGIFSRGMQQRLSIARALLHRPDIMLLDEPDTGLDQQALATLWAVMKGNGAERRTVIATTHSLERAFDLADRFIILCRGTIAAVVEKRGLDVNRLHAIYHESTAVKA
jgi:heme exporter protein A